jgi:predicted MPP superfamily phosphohydrolase
MRASIVHLSDIHFGPATNEVGQKLEKLADAICTTDPTCSSYAIVLAGDIANTADQAEYACAKTFIESLGRAMAKRQPESHIDYVSVPGNHDCSLPELETVLRRVLCDAIQPTLQSPKPDASILKALLQPQDAYFSFSSSLCGVPKTEAEKICARRTINVNGKKVLFNLFNTAICSQRAESQDLAVPMELIRETLEQTVDCDISISVCHHPQYWLQADVGVAFRDYLERISDIVLTGHQHHPHSFEKQSHDGQSLLYAEGAVLQEPGKFQTSGFSIIVLNLDELKSQIVTYRWSNGFYQIVNRGGWSQCGHARSNSAVPVPSSEFLAKLSDSGIGLTHTSKGLIPLDAVFEYPDANLSSFADPGTNKTIRGTSLLQHLTQVQKAFICGFAFTGKTSLLKTVTKEWLRTRTIYPLLVSGESLTASDQTSFDRLLDDHCIETYGDGSITKYRQLLRSQKALLIDDWDSSSLDSSAREKLLHLADKYFGKIILCTQGAAYVQHLTQTVRTDGAKWDFEILTLKPMSYVGRGNLIEKWLALDTPSDNAEFTRKVEEIERLVGTVIGKNTLPSLPFIVLAILQAVQRNQDVLPENGSFGYLYEVLITTALSNSLDVKAQVDKKYTFLSRLAYYFFEHSIERCWVFLV